MILKVTILCIITIFIIVTYTLIDCYIVKNIFSIFCRMSYNTLYLYFIKQTETMKATIENLKANRVVIIESLTTLFGAERLSSSMSILKDRVEYAMMFDSSKEIETIIDEMVSDGIFEVSKNATKTANMLAEMAFNRGEEWDNKTQKYVKL